MNDTMLIVAWVSLLVIFHLDDNVARWMGETARIVVTSFNGG